MSSEAADRLQSDVDAAREALGEPTSTDVPTLEDLLEEAERLSDAIRDRMAGIREELEALRTVRTATRAYISSDLPETAS